MGLTATERAITAAQELARRAARTLHAVLDGQSLEDRAMIQTWARDLRRLEAEMDRHLTHMSER